MFQGCRNKCTLRKYSTYQHQLAHQHVRGKNMCVHTVVLSWPQCGWYNIIITQVEQRRLHDKMEIHLCTKAIRKSGVMGHVNNDDSDVTNTSTSSHITFLDVLVPIPWSLVLNKIQMLMKTVHSKSMPARTMPLPYKKLHTITWWIKRLCGAEHCTSLA